MAMMMRAVGVMALLLVAGAAQSKVVISGTRVIYPAQEREVAVRLNNLAEHEPSVLQIWLDDGQEDSSPDTVEVPFVVSPPVFRMDPGSAQALRLSYTGEPLPGDRESLFWLNVLEIPPSAAEEGDEAQLLQFAYRTRLKTLFRPQGLAPAADKVPQQLQWSLHPAQGKRGAIVQVRNPTPYFVSFAGLKLVDGPHSTAYKRGQHVTANMVAPHAQQQFEFPDLARRPGAGAQIAFVTIGDYGNRVESVAPLSVGDGG